MNPLGITYSNPISFCHAVCTRLHLCAYKIRFWRANEISRWSCEATDNVKHSVGVGGTKEEALLECCREVVRYLEWDIHYDATLHLDTKARGKPRRAVNYNSIDDYLRDHVIYSKTNYGH